MADHVVILKPAEYNKLNEADQVLDQIVSLTGPYANEQSLETVRIALENALEDERLHEAGHLEWALVRAIKMLVHVAAQDARQKAERGGL